MHKKHSTSKAPSTSIMYPPLPEKLNVFVLNTGRCGSTTFIKACSHITNYTSAHESRTGLVGDERFDYPSHHIEADNRLSWLLGRLEYYYGASAVYVHLKRTSEDVAMSFVRRYNTGIMKAYREAILMHLEPRHSPSEVAMDYCETVNYNINSFLKDKPYKMEFAIENYEEDFVRFWNLISAKGDLEPAIKEFSTKYNASAGITNMRHTNVYRNVIFSKYSLMSFFHKLRNKV